MKVERLDSMHEPVHTQLMDPAEDPEEFIASSIYWYPLIFPTRTEVLENLMLCSGNGYEWGEDGNIRSVFSHIEPDRDRLDRYEEQAREWESAGAQDMADWSRLEHARLLVTRADHASLARTYGPVRMTEQGYPDATQRQARMITSRDLAWTLLGSAPANVTPAWQRIITETLLLFADILTEQGSLW